MSTRYVIVYRQKRNPISEVIENAFVLSRNIDTGKLAHYREDRRKQWIRFRTKREAVQFLNETILDANQTFKVHSGLIVPRYVALDIKKVKLRNSEGHSKAVDSKNRKFKNEEPTIAQSVSSAIIHKDIVLKDKKSGKYIRVPDNPNDHCYLTEKENCTLFSNNSDSFYVLRGIQSRNFMWYYHDMDLIEVDLDDNPIIRKPCSDTWRYREQ